MCFFIFRDPFLFSCEILPTPVVLPVDFVICKGGGGVAADMPVDMQIVAVSAVPSAESQKEIVELQTVARGKGFILEVIVVSGKNRFGDADGISGEETLGGSFDSYCFLSGNAVV